MTEHVLGTSSNNLPSCRTFVTSSLSPPVSTTVLQHHSAHLCGEHEHVLVHALTFCYPLCCRLDQNIMNKTRRTEPPLPAGLFSSYFSIKGVNVKQTWPPMVAVPSRTLQSASVVVWTPGSVELPPFLRVRCQSLCERRAGNVATICCRCLFALAVASNQRHCDVLPGSERAQYPQRETPSVCPAPIRTTTGHDGSRERCFRTMVFKVGTPRGL